MRLKYLDNSPMAYGACSTEYRSNRLTTASICHLTTGTNTRRGLPPTNALIGAVLRVTHKATKGGIGS